MGENNQNPSPPAPHLSHHYQPLPGARHSRQMTLTRPVTPTPNDADQKSSTKRIFEIRGLMRDRQPLSDHYHRRPVAGGDGGDGGRWWWGRR
ncbi:hypothetical protein Hanom_Chr15g01363631 [Helianthus anomalus]